MLHLVVAPNAQPHSGQMQTKWLKPTWIGHASCLCYVGMKLWILCAICIHIACPSLLAAQKVHLTVTGHI